MDAPTVHGLLLREEHGRAFVGAVDGGDFLEVDALGARVLRELCGGATGAEVAERLRQEGIDLDVPGFLRELESAGLPLGADRGLAAERASTAALRRAGFRRAFGRGLDAVALALLLASSLGDAWTGAFEAIATFWHDTPTLAKGISLVALFALTLLAHEASHYLVAWSHGLPARLRLSTRLDEIVCETRVPALWCLPRAERLRFYLAGLRTDLIVACTLALLLGHCAQGGIVASAIAAGLCATGLRLAFEALVFARTDLYFVLMELLRHPNLRDDAITWLLALRRGRESAFLAHRSPAEHRRIRAFAAFLVVAWSAFVASLLWWALPFWSGLWAEAGAELRLAASLADAARALLLPATVAGVWLLFLAVFLRGLRRG